MTVVGIGKLAITGSLPGREKTDMPARNISLTDEQDDFVERVVKAGEHPNASERYAMRFVCFSNGGGKMR
jgi:hypothetical protein